MGTQCCRHSGQRQLARDFKTSIKMPCMKCGAQMRLALIEPRDQVYDVLTYRCTPCDSGESLLYQRPETVTH